MKLFELGHIVMTQGIAVILDKNEQAIVDLPLLIHKHVTGDWGDMCEEDKAQNDASVNARMRIFSAYQLTGEKIWIITEADRSSTTVLLPEEY